MGWLDKARAAAQEVGRAAKEKAGEAAVRAEKQFGEEEWYRGAKTGASEVASGAKGVAQGARSVASEMTTGMGQTDIGKRLGAHSRRISGLLANLPVFSLSSDVIKERNGVGPLTEHLRQGPHDPERHLWLAEALRRARVDQVVYKRARSVIDPSFLVVGEAVRALNSLGKAPAEPTERKLLKNAFALSKKRISRQPRDATALHVMARVYQLQDMPVEAVKHAKLAWLADPNDSRPLITLGRLYLMFEQHGNAERAAQKVLAASNSYGNEILADLAMLADGEPTARVERYEQLRRCGTPTAPPITAPLWIPSASSKASAEPSGAG